jgi:hypothetical protein
LLTLVLVPVVYTLLDGLPTAIGHGLGRLFRVLRLGRRAPARPAGAGAPAPVTTTTSLARNGANGTVASHGTAGTEREPDTAAGHPTRR